MTVLEQRAAVAAEARRWIGTPYHHQADVLGAGVDCGMLLVRVYVDCGIVLPFDPRPYPDEWHLHRDDERYLGFLATYGHEVETPQLGDVAIWRIGRAYSHGGIVVGLSPCLVVHAYQPEGMVVESDLSLSSPLSANRHLKFFDPFREGAA
ncbi:MAG: hypothetical protein KGI37_05100 [Alphaproteobacteria bacterium]|nr:hypothetical protein [Alphaproteobacteria bacterium]